MKFEVPIVFRGQANYIVEADSPEQAKAIAEQAYQDGKPPTPLGNEWEEIERVGEIIPIPDQGTPR